MGSLIPENILRYSETYSEVKKWSCVPCKRAHNRCQGPPPCKRCVERKVPFNCIGTPKKDVLRFTNYFIENQQKGLYELSETHCPCLSWWRRKREPQGMEDRSETFSLFYCTYTFLQLGGFEAQEILHSQNIETLFPNFPSDYYLDVSQSIGNNPMSSEKPIEGFVGHPEEGEYLTLEMMRCVEDPKSVSCKVQVQEYADLGVLLEIEILSEEGFLKALPKTARRNLTQKREVQTPNEKRRRKRRSQADSETESEPEYEKERIQRLKPDPESPESKMKISFLTE